MVGKEVVAAIDIETSDPYLKEQGTGCVRGEGYIITVGIYCPDWDIDGYYTWDDLLEDEEAIELLRDTEVVKVFHNGLYDLGWLVIWGGLEVNNTDDTLTRETLLDAYRYTYNLQACCDCHGVAGKNKEDTIDMWYEKHYAECCQRAGTRLSKKAIENLPYIPVEIVGAYNLQDCHATYDLYQVQQTLLEQQNLLEWNQVERDIIPWLVQVKKNGLRIDKKGLKDLTTQVSQLYAQESFKWEMSYGDVNPSSNKQLTDLFHKLGLEVPVSAKTNNPTFDADALTDVEHPVAQQIMRIKALRKLIGTYLEGQFVTYQYKEHINGDLHPAKSDDGGTVTGRFSCLGIGTRVFTTEHGYIPIEEIRSGMHIVTHTGKVRPVKRLMFMGVSQVGYLGKLLCTAHHPILSEDGRYWIGAECCNSYMEVDDNGLYQRFGLSKTGSGLLSERGQAYEETGTGTLWCMLASNSQNTDIGHSFRCVGSGEGPSVLPFQAWREESNDGENGGTSSQLHWGCGRWPRVQDTQGEWKVLLYTQSSDGRGSWHQCVGAPRVGGSPSYRWEPTQQFPGQLGTRNEQGTWEAARSVPEYRGWRPVGILPTFDIEVLGEEHSFIAEGIIVHNCSSPNLQNISAREEKFGNEVRSLFIPEDGCLLGAFDYKQIEYRVFTHFAIACNAPGAGEAEQRFKDDPNTDYHAMGQKMMGWYFEDDKKKTKVFRHIMKNLGFGSLYGLGARSFAHKFRRPLKMAHPDYTGSLQTLAKSLQDMYYTKIPFIKYTCKQIENTAERRGYVVAIGGRRNRFRHDRGAYVMVNYLVQGSASSIIKKAIADSWKAGVWDVLIPHTMVHDELVFSIPDTKAGYEACLKLKECMANAYKLRVPIGVDTEIGPDWGHCNEENWEAFEAKWK